MDKKIVSTLQEKAHGTYQRNERIRQLVAAGLNYAEIGRMYNLTRQAIRAIANKPKVS